MTTLTAQRTRIDVFKFRHLWLHFLDASSHSRYMIELTEHASYHVTIVYQFKNMAEERSLREVNLILLSRLHVAQKTIWKDVNFIKANNKHSEGNKRLENSVFKGFGPDRTPISMRSRRKALSELSTKMTPRKQTEKGSVGFNMAWTSDQKKKCALTDSAKGLGSILRTPQSKSKRETQV